MKKAVLKFDERDHGRSADIGVDQEIEICLPENPTAGFRWRLAVTNKPVCALLEDAFEPGIKPGQPGIHRWRFRTLAEGSTKIELAYRRTWESGAAATRLFFLELNCKK